MTSSWSYNDTSLSNPQKKKTPQSQQQQQGEVIENFDLVPPGMSVRKQQQPQKGMGTSAGNGEDDLDSWFNDTIATASASKQRRSGTATPTVTRRVESTHLQNQTQKVVATKSSSFSFDGDDDDDDENGGWDSW